MKRSKGFTLIEMMVVIVIMAVLAVAVGGGVAGLITNFKHTNCEAARKEAVQAYVSDWMSGEPLPADPADWLKNYLAENQVSCGSAGQWTIAVAPEADGRQTVTVTCPVHGAGAPTAATFGAPSPGP